MDTNPDSAAAVEEEAAAEEEVVEEEGTELAPEPEEPQESAQAKRSDELKVVIILKADRIMLGVQSPTCDPVYETLEGTLAAALKRVPKLVREAKEKWDANPLNPAANLPKPEPAPTPARAATAPKQKPAQPSFF